MMAGSAVLHGGDYFFALIGRIFMLRNEIWP
jgi:hypothetical protein